MSGFHDVLANIALVVGGTQPNATTEPFFYSGAQKGDSTGISGLTGCYLGPFDVINATPPFAVVMLGSGTAGSDFRGGGGLFQGTLFKQDYVKLQICVGLTEPQKQHDTLIAYVDLVPTAFAAKMTLNSTANMLDAFPEDYRFAQVKWGGTDYMCIEWRIRVRRDVAGQTYAT